MRAGSLFTIPLVIALVLGPAAVVGMALPMAVQPSPVVVITPEPAVTEAPVIEPVLIEELLPTVIPATGGGDSWWPTGLPTEEPAEEAFSGTFVCTGVKSSFGLSASSIARTEIVFRADGTCDLYVFGVETAGASWTSTEDGFAIDTGSESFALTEAEDGWHMQYQAGVELIFNPAE